MARKSLEERFWEKVEKGDGCWVWTAAKDSHGYGLIGIAGRKLSRAHRLSWELANGPIPEGVWVLHHCDNPACVRPDHLFLGTNADNVRDRENKGRNVNPRGEAHGMSKLTARQVLQIRALYSTGKYSQLALKKRFGVSDVAIGSILHGETWAHITDDLQGKIAQVLQQANHGEANGSSKLTADQVREIRALYTTGEHTQLEIGKRFGVDLSTISYIVRHVTWAHIP